MLLHKLNIGNVELDNNIIFAPMAGVTDLAFRKICKDHGAGLVECEMVSSKAIFYNDDKTLKMINTTGEKRPVSMQIFGSEPEIMAKAAEYLSEKAEIIDINMGCPAPKVVKNGDGSKLLLDLNLVRQIVEEVVKASKVPVTVKIRKGWDDKNVVAIDAAKIIENAGASAIIVHGRTRDQFYTGKADWEIIKEVKKNVSIPVIGNGDIVDGETAKRMLEQTGVDGVMVGRAALGNPWIFEEIRYYLEGKKYEGPSKSEILDTILRQYDLLYQEKGEYTAVREMRKHIAWYLKGMKDASVMRNEINLIDNMEDVIEKLKIYFGKLI